MTDREKISRLTAMCSALVTVLEEAHDTHIYAPDDEHTKDCSYCSICKRAKKLIVTVSK